MAPSVKQETDLKQVSELFNNCIAAVRSRSAGNLDAKAAEWLNSTRVKLMKDIEASFYDLAQKADLKDPLQLPGWVLDPTIPLVIFTNSWPPALAPYKEQFTENISALVTDCGLDAIIRPDGLFHSLYVGIRFPQEISNRTVKREGGVIKPEAIKSFSASVLRITQKSHTPNANASTSRRRKRNSEDDEDAKPDVKKLDGPHNGPAVAKRTRLSTARALSASNTTEPVASLSRRGRRK